MISDFPVTTFSRENGLWKQIGHLESEVVEVAAAFYKPQPERIAEELCDVIVSAVTALRILKRDWGIDPDALMDQVHDKNRARGYYL